MGKKVNLIFPANSTWQLIKSRLKIKVLLTDWFIKLLVAAKNKYASTNKAATRVLANTKKNLRVLANTKQTKSK